jgi:beta-lactamase class A
MTRLLACLVALLLASPLRGILGYSVRNLDTGEQLSLRGDETFQTASLIKVAILVTLYDLVEKKMLSASSTRRFR